MAGFGDGTSLHVFQRAMTIPGGGRFEVGEYTVAFSTPVPSTLSRVYWGYARCIGEATKMAFPSMVDDRICITTRGASFCTSAAAAGAGEVWQYVLFGD